MDTLVISDHFYNLKENIDYIKWDKFDQFRPEAYKNILIDIQFDLKEITNVKKELLYKIKEELFDKNLSKEYRKNIIIIYGESNHEIDYEVPYDKYQEDSKMEEMNFCLIDIIKKLFDEDDYDNVKPISGNSIFSMASDPFDTYFNYYAIKKNYFIFKYKYTSNIHNIIPLAAMNDEDYDLVAFEYKCIKSNILLLPPYNITIKNDVFSFILDIFNMYNYIYKISYLIKMLKTNYNHDVYLLKNINELDKAIQYKMFISTILLSARIIDYLLPKIDVESMDKQTLGFKINRYYDKQIIDDSTYKLLKFFTDFRNWAAHPDKYPNQQINFSDAINAVETLNLISTSYKQIQKKIIDYNERRYDLENKGGIT